MQFPFQPPQAQSPYAGLQGVGASLASQQNAQQFNPQNAVNAFHNNSGMAPSATGVGSGLGQQASGSYYAPIANTYSQFAAPIAQNQLAGTQLAANQDLANTQLNYGYGQLAANPTGQINLQNYMTSLGNAGATNQQQLATIRQQGGLAGQQAYQNYLNQYQSQGVNNSLGMNQALSQANLQSARDQSQYYLNSLQQQNGLLSSIFSGLIPSLGA